MGAQLNIRNAKVIARVREQAALRGMTMTDLIDLAVDNLPALQKPVYSEAEKAERLAELKRLMDLSRASLRPDYTTSFDEFYDPKTGAPI
jgi:hypothetical protein